MPNFKKNTSPAMKKSAYKMSGYSYPGVSPMKKDTEEVVSKNSPGPGWTKTKGTNIWSPPKAKAKATMTKIKRDIDMTKTPTLGPKKLPV